MNSILEPREGDWASDGEERNAGRRPSEGRTRRPPPAPELSAAGMINSKAYWFRLLCSSPLTCFCWQVCVAQTILTVKVCFLPGPRSLEQIFCSESLSAAPERRRDPLMRPAVRLMPRNKTRDAGARSKATGIICSNKCAMLCGCIYTWISVGVRFVVFLLLVINIQRHLVL